MGLAAHQLPDAATAPNVFRFYRPRCDRIVARVLAMITASTHGVTP